MANRRKDIYNKSYFSQQYDSALKWLDEAEIRECNKSIIKRWILRLSACGCSKIRIGKLLTQTKIILQKHDFELTNPSIVDLETILAWMKHKDDWSESTKIDYYRWIRQFYKWLYEDSDFSNIDLNSSAKNLKWIKRNIKTPLQRKKVDSEELITENDLLLLIEKGCSNNFEKAFIHVLHEAGLRIEEILNMRFNDIEFKENRAHLNIIGKTGERTITLVLSVGYLRQWMAECPHRDKNNFYIWSSHKHINQMKPLKYRGAVKLIKRVYERAGLNKKCNPHHFRHSRLTLNAEFMSDNLLKVFAGWSKGSRCVETYIHTGRKEVDNAILKHYGLEKDEINITMPIKCPNCLSLCNSNTAFCGCCGTPLTSKAHKKKEATEDYLLFALQKIMESDELRTKFSEFQKNVS